MVNADELRALIDGHHEWLLVREGGRSFPLNCTEIDIEIGAEKTMFSFPDDAGFHSWRLNGFELEGSDLAVDVAGAFGRNRETLRLIPRTPAAELAAEVELARLKKANEIGRMIADGHADTRLERIALNTGNGRMAQIIFSRGKTQFGAIGDVTAAMTPEAIMTSAMLWYERLGKRKKKPVLDVWIVAEKRQARNLQKLHALLSERWRAIVTIFEISRKADPAEIVELPKRQIRDLWREKSRPLTLPDDPQPSSIARELIAASPENTDIVYSKQGETVRFHGLPFARVRTMMGREKAWFGIGKAKQPLTPETDGRLSTLLAELELNRTPEPPNKRHELYRTAPESWLESILRRNIKLLDANLILAPIYNQFRSSNDKIDLLALRKDGRLVIIELKTQPDREMIFQAADYWRKIELQRRRGILAAANLFGGLEIIDRPALIYLAAPALSFHRDVEYFAAAVSPEIEIWRFELHEHWRSAVKVIARMSHSTNY
ncbi:MAG: hypothetical protein KA746_00545 [Pyrinomonadaceae bacterium]|nr:hypothetical protein [Pyrinomonadaceae bacterium]MBP6213471.1 hypothetical protein [Pyrinomonadaceae bacterium]